MKRLLFVLAISMATVYSVQATLVSEAEARQVADRFFASQPAKFSTPSGRVADVRITYTAEQGRYYVFERGNNGGFVVVAGDDRLPQILGYGSEGDFSSPDIPAAVQYWMNEMNRQIAYLQSHDEAVAHSPAPQATAVAPLMTTLWDQDAPYNDLCPTYTDSKGNTGRAVTGCVATAFAQVMNYYQWPLVGRGSHSYVCNVNDMTETQLSADFSQSQYRWDLMLDYYDANSSAESCEAVAKLMSDVGISMDMNYGSSSGAYERVAMRALKNYFCYGDNCYLLERDYFNAIEWDQILVDEISALRPIIYCGYDLSGRDGGSGHCFVLDGFNNDGYFHVNWGWGGSYDGYFLVSLLAPASSYNFEFMQDGIFGLVPETRNDEVEKVLYVRSQMVPKSNSAPLGDRISLSLDNFIAEGNQLDTAGYEERDNRRNYYALIPMSIGVYDEGGVELQNKRFSYQQSLEDRWFMPGTRVSLDLLPTLEDGEYTLKLSYSVDGGEHYDRQVMDFSGKEVYVKMVVCDGIAYLKDCFLSNSYSLDSFVLPAGIQVNQTIDVGVNLTYRMWGPDDSPVGNVYLSLLKEGSEVTRSELCEVMVPANTVQNYQIPIVAPAEGGRYDLVLNDESGNRMMIQEDWFSPAYEAVEHLYILPVCQSLAEDFESMTANSSTSDKNVQGTFTTWNFTKSGVRAPGEGRCNGNNAVMMKKASSFSNSEPLYRNFFMAQAIIFNQSGSASKYTLDYSTDGGTTWQRAYTLDGGDAVDAPEKSQVNAMWLLDLKSAQPATFRIAMTSGSAATYIDDFSLFYTEKYGDVNGDGEVNIADVNALLAIIMSGGMLPAADVNVDDEVNIADINAVIDIILGNVAN